MLDIKFLRNDPESVRRALQNRGGRYVPALEDLLAADAEWKAANGESEPLRARRNQAADEMGRLKREKKDATALLKEMEELKTRLKGLDEKTAAAQARVDEKVLGLPNLPHPSVPVGADAGQNREIRRWGEPKKFPFKPRDHQDIGEKLGVLDMARAAKLSGARFALLSGAGAKMERALIHFMLDLHTGVHGYTEIFPPFLVTRQTMTGTGQLPKFADELYATKDDDLFLIPPAEVPLTNLYRDEPLDEATLPRALCAYTACFRREAGSYGKDTRGLIRNHQFNKIELVRFVRPEDSLAELEKLTGHAEEVLKRLGLPYRVMELCTGDLGFSSAKTYDLEVWLPAENGGQGAYREISSCSTFTDFQARRIGLRYKKSDGSRALMHTLNGSGVAVGRTLAAVLENYQDADGSVAVPEALRTLMGIDRLSPP
ncbi:MAG TPA: serine--tRNA ligase [Elusimicrobiota bacterium]|nr:serine--tRNA ligase [Elusimicrobiota bacterium]HMU95970.1 serine--tRNA ligase [Elusimicrobiota bacterium]